MWQLSRRPLAMMSAHLATPHHVVCTSTHHTFPAQLAVLGWPSQNLNPLALSERTLNPADPAAYALAQTEMCCCSASAGAGHTTGGVTLTQQGV